MTILVIGASGNVGRAVLAQLTAAGEAVRAASRNPGAHAFPPSVQTVTADLDQPGSLPAALVGIDKVFLYARHAGMDAFLTAAKTAGVRKLVLLSSAAVDASDHADDPIATMHGAVERTIASSGLEWAAIRPTAFATNALWWAHGIRAEDVVRVAYPEAQAAPIHEADIAAVAVAALTRADITGPTGELTGPQSLTQREQVAAIAAATGRPVRLEELTPEQAHEHLRRVMPPQIADLMMRYWIESIGKSARVTPEVERITGQPARSFAQWARDHAGDFGGAAA